MLRNCLLLTALMSGALAAHATDYLILDNGDRISGTFVREENGVITFNSPVLGDISVPAGKATIQLEPAPTVEGAAAEAAAIVADDDPPEEDAEEAEAEQKEADMVTASLNDAQAWVDRNKPEGWTGKLSAGLSYVESNTETMAVNLNLNGKKDSAPNHYRFDLYYEYDKSTDDLGVETKNLDKYGASVGYDYDINDWMFFNSDLDYLRNQVKDIRHQVDLDLGLGFRVIDEEAMKLNIIPAYTLQYKDAAGLSQKWFHLATLKEDFMYQLNEIVRFEQKASASVAPADTSDYQYMVRAALISKLAEWIDASVAYQLTFDNTVGTGGAKREQQVIFALGVPY